MLKSNQNLIKTGIFGGSFDPVHKGHVKLVRTVAEREGLDRVIVIPNWRSPWKLSSRPASCMDRMNMLKLAFKEDPYVEISDFEIAQEKSCYTFDTLTSLKEMHPEWDIYFIAGQDSAENFAKWYRGEELLKNFKFLWTERFDNISSTEIRGRLAQGKGIEDLVPQSVSDYVRVHGLYTDEEHSLYHQLDEFVRSRLKPSRYAHTMGVVQMARELAERYGADVRSAEIAAVFHDAFREAGNLEHGDVAADYLRDVVGIHDEDIINAIRWHTTGRPGMSLLEKIIKIADNLEPGRVFPDVEKLREAIGDNVNITLITLMKHTKEYVLSVGGNYAEISNQAIEYLENLDSSR